MTHSLSCCTTGLDDECYTSGSVFSFVAATVNHMWLTDYTKPQRRWNSTAHFRIFCVFPSQRRKVMQHDFTCFCHPVWRWWGRWWCPSAGPSTAPSMSGGRLGMPACPSAGSEPHSGHALRRDSPQASWEAQRPESGLSPGAISAYLGKILTGNRILLFSSCGK